MWLLDGFKNKVKWWKYLRRKASNCKDHLKHCCLSCTISCYDLLSSWIYLPRNSQSINPLNAELNPICHLLTLLGGATIVVVSRLRVKCEAIPLIQLFHTHNQPWQIINNMAFTSQTHFYFVLKILFWQHVSTRYLVIIKSLHKNTDPLSF